MKVSVLPFENQQVLRRTGARDKRFWREMISSKPHTGRLSSWQLIYLQSRVNGASYHGKELARQTWSWPKDTYLQQRLQYLKGSQMELGQELQMSSACLNRSAEARFELLYKKLFGGS